MSGAPGLRTRVLVVLPSWLGDVVMATPALRALRERSPGSFVGALARPGVDEVIDGLGVFDVVHRAPAGGIMAPKVAAQRVRQERYGAALLLTNSFSTALSARLAGIPRRVGYERDGRAMLLTERLPAARRRDAAPYSRSTTDPSAWAPVPACDYYAAITRFFLTGDAGDAGVRMGALELVATARDEQGADGVLARAGVRAGGVDAPFVVLNPGANDERKRWPAERFAAVGAALARERGVRVLVNGAPGERELAEEVSRRVDAMCGGGGAIPGAAALPALGMTIGALKAVLKRARLLVTNDTGPRHIAAAFGTPVVALFGPTDHRWTTITGYLPRRRDGRDAPLEQCVLADPTLPEEEVANDHPARCAVEKISVECVVEAARGVMGE